MFGAATNAADGGGSSDHGLRRQTRSVVSHLGSCSGGYGTSSSSTSYDAPGLRRFSEASRVSTRRDCYPDLMLPAVDEADTFDAMLGMSDDDDAMPNATSDGRSSTSRRGSSRATRKQLGLPPARCWDPVFTCEGEEYVVGSSQCGTRLSAAQTVRRDN
ncbi:unnamed protein product [Notodromas monacha]|uniref:Uncharacterized protein n=1 Tax=Notodromas monacha TaxID=399045 RepID=A0A7R9GG08_9CRUS|nr:unnamed protein product [Notodromas monacha]CAG0919687.1 unnamed protein product [Notodromas monacha]